MKKIILLSALVLLLIPATASALALDPPTLTITPEGSSFTLTGWWDWGKTISIFIRFCDGEVITTGDITPPDDPATAIFTKPLAYVVVYYGQGEQVVASRSCYSHGKPLFKMYLLMRGDEGCILLSETPPSVERQQALCFPASDPDWTADRLACVGYVTSEDYWPCDSFGFSRLPLESETGPNLMKVWRRHKARENN
jgi:hypothetical protein